MCECKLILLIGALVMCNVIFVTPFNIDEFNYAAYRRENRSMFGFTVAVHKDHRNQGWVLVGAPEAHSIYQSRRVRPYHGGAVYKCRIDADDPCEEIPFSGESEYTNIALDNKTVQWFGATLSSSGRIVACAPRYVWYTKDLNRRDPVGTCYVADGNFQNSEEYSPCRTMNWGYHRQGSCQAGFSAAIDRSGDRLFIGAPGSYYWQGQIYSVDAHARFNFTPGIYGNKGYGAKGSVHQQSLATREPVFSTREGRAQDDDSYMGYSTVVGHFLEDQEFEGVAVGMPRGNNLRGKVLLFTWDLHNYKNLTVSRQIGAYFGYSITAADVNGDGRLDIIVGAPMHTEPNNDMKYDVGRVYIFYQTRESATSFSNFTYIDGVESKSRFGHSVSTLGDLNQDGCEDFAVGAPYAGPDGRGAVYIYYGSKDGNLKKSEQVIYAKNIETNIQTFGFSVTGGLDLDGNDYPDMAVGAYLSDAAFFFRAKPVAVVDASVRFRITHTQKQIDIKKKNCFLPSGLEAICVDVDFCMKYSGKGIPARLLFNVEYILDSKKPNTTRMGFFSRKTATFIDKLELQKDRRSCKSERIYIKSDIRDKLTPLVAEMKYSIVDDTRYGNPFRDPRSHLIPALDLNSPPSRKDYLIVQKNCGTDNVCIPDLHITVNPNVKKYLLGSQNDLEIDVVVSNFGEDSFETTYEIKIPKGIFYKKVVTKPGLPGILCSPPGSDNILSCDIGNPLPAGKIASFKVILQPTYQKETPSSYEFDMYVNSTNPELNSTMANNHYHVSIDIWINATLELRGDSYPPTLYYNESHYTAEEIIRENDIGPQVTHVYYVRNSGPATIQEAEVFILWPSRTVEDEDLLYLLEPPEIQGNVICDAGPVNYKNYIVGFHGPSIFDRLRIDTSSVDKVDKQSSINITETGKGVASGLGVVNRNETLEKEVTSSGDSSILIERRHNESSGVSSQGSLNVNGEYVHTEARSRTVWVNGVSHTTWENTTVVKDANGKVLKTFYTNNDPAHYFSNFSGSSLEYGSLAGSGKVTFTNQTRTEEEQNRILEQKRLENAAILRKQQLEEEKSRREEYEKRLQEESQTDDRIRQEQRARQEENRRQDEERRRQEEHARREEEWRRQEEALRAQEVERRRLEIERRRQEEEERRIQQYGYDEVNGVSEEYSTEEERRRQEESYQQGGVQESAREGQYGQTSTSRGSQHRILTGYYDQQGVYHEYPRDVYGQIIYNKTYTADSTGTIPVDLRGSQSAQHHGFTETSIGNGFRVQTLDLGNAGSESSVYGNQGGAFHGAGGSSLSESESGSFYGAGSSSRQDQESRQAASSGDGYRQDWHVERTYSHSGQIPPTIVHNSVEKDNVPTDRPSPYARSRGKRETPEVDPYAEINGLVGCKATHCNYIKCHVGALEKDKEVVIALRSRLNVREVKNLTSTQPIKISSMIVGRISKLHMRTESGQILKEHEVFTEIPAKEVELVPEVAPLWIYVVSAVAGVVMLLLLIWLLSKCGFFKRNRPSSSAPERQPLSRNGYHSGDEAL